jgi:hypothetical protein
MFNYCKFDHHIHIIFEIYTVYKNPLLKYDARINFALIRYLNLFKSYLVRFMNKYNKFLKISLEHYLISYN